MAVPYARRHVRSGAGAMGASRFVGSTRSYEGASVTSQELSNFNPTLTEATDESLGSRDRIVSRIRDLERNDPIVRGGIEKQVNATVGAEMWLSARVNWKALGFSPQVGFELSGQFERTWNEWANDPWHFNDLERSLNFSQMIELAYTHEVREGDAVAVIYAREPLRLQKYATQVKLMDPDLLSNPNNGPETTRLRGGIEMNSDGAPVAYHFALQHPNATVIDAAKMNRWTRVPRYSRTGRPQVVHSFHKNRAGLKRGVSKLAAGIPMFKQLGRYRQAEINAQLLGASIPLFIKSKTPDSAIEALAPADDGTTPSHSDLRAEFHEASQITFNGVRIPALFDHEEIDSVDTKRAAGHYASFESAMLRALAPLFSLTYEQLSSDWGNVNYSSARAALIEIWRTIDADRVRFTQQFCTPIYQAVIWEAVVRGMITLPPGAPDFVENLAHYTRCRWIGPGRGWVDPVKEATGADMRVASYYSDAEQEAAEQGQDIYENMENAARIRESRQALGLPDPVPPAGPGRPPEQSEEPAGNRRQRQNA